MLNFVRRATQASTAVALVLCAAAPAAAQTLASGWHKGFNNEVRLLAGRGGAEAGERLFAGVEILMPTDWKTYWRTPGDAGGVPPEFDWAASENLSSATVLYPAPRRLSDKSGVVIGYANSVVFPVEIAPIDATKPIRLRLKTNYGVCKELCVPAEAELTLDIPPDAKSAVEIERALALVPRTTPRDGKDPILKKWTVERTEGKPRLLLEAAFPTQSTGDAFVEAPAGAYLPLPNLIDDKSGRTVFELDLSDVDLAALKGAALTVTLVGPDGQSETKIVFN